MRIGIVTSSYAISPTDTVTAGVFVRDLAMELASQGHQVHVITPHKYGEIVPSPLIQEHYIPWLGGARDLASASMKNPLNLLRYATLVVSGLWVVRKYARQHALDALLAMWAIPSGLFTWLTWKFHGTPYGVWALGSDIWARKNYPFGDLAVRAVLRHAKFCFADGLDLAQEVTQLAGTTCDFVPSMRRLPARSMPAKLELPPAKMHFLYIGRYEKNKGPDILVEAVRELVASGQDVHLHMFGHGSMEGCLLDRAKGYEDHIHVGGYADPQTVISFMSVCDWLVIPSRIESIPLIFVDAMQMRLPVIVTDVGDLGDLVSRYKVGKNAGIPDPRTLAITLREALSCPRAMFSGEWEDVLSVFDITRSAKRCSDALAQAVEETIKR